MRGTAFIGGSLVTTQSSKTESFDEACAILGVDPEASWEEVDRVFKIKAQYSHPDKFTDPQEKKAAEARFKRIKMAYDLVKRVKEPK